MSRYYRMQVEIAGFRVDRIDVIKAAAETEWPFENWLESEGKLTASEEDSLGGGESEEEFTERLSLAIWKANGEFCEVTVSATYMEELPYEIHSLDQDDYERLLNAPEATEEST